MRRPGLSASSFTPAFGALPYGSGTSQMPDIPSIKGSLGSPPPIDATLEYIRSLSQAQPEQEDTRPYIAFSPSNKQMFVNGFTFDENDATRALESEQYLGQAAARPEAGDWQRIPASVYQDYLQSIRDPSAGTRFAKSFSSGVGSLQQLWGAALMAATDGGAGQDLYEAGGARMERLQPFAKKFSEVKNLDDAGDFMVSLLGSQAPNILESITTALIGAGLGAAVGSTGTPVGTVAGGLGGAATGIFAKGAIKDQLKAIAQKKLAKGPITPDEEALWRREAGKIGAATQLAARKKQAGDILSPDEQKLIRQGAAVTGALTLSTLENYGIGVGDVYGEMLEKGVADEPGARASAFGYAVPYAALSTAPEFLGALALLRPTKRTGLGAAASRFGTGLAVGAAGEGVSEASQEGLIMGAAEGFGAQYTPQERGERLLEAGVAGAVLGGITGGPINLLRRPERDAGITPPAAPTAPAEPPEGPTLADIPDIPSPPDPESVLGTPGLRPPPPEAPFPSGEAYEDISPAASYMGGRPEEEEFVGAPPVRPGQEGTFFQDDDLGPIVTPAAGSAAAESTTAAAAADPNQESMFTRTGGVRETAAAAAGFGASKQLSPDQTKTLAWLTRKNTKEAGVFPAEAATNLGSANGVLIQPDTLPGSSKNIKTFVKENKGSIIELQLGSKNNPKSIAYDEALWGSPENFAKAMGFEYSLIADGTFVRHFKSGRTSEIELMAAYKPPKKPRERKAAAAAAAAPAPVVEPTAPKAGKVKRGAKGAAGAKAPPKANKVKRGSAAQANKTAAERPPKDAVQEQKPEGVDAQKQAGTGGGVRKKNTAGGKPAGEGKAKTTEKKPLRQTDVVRRQTALSEQQNAALLTELGTDVQGMIEMLTGDNFADVDAAIDRVLEAEKKSAPSDDVNFVLVEETKAEKEAKARAEYEKNIAEEYSKMSTEDLLAEASPMQPEGKVTKKGRVQILLLKELFTRLRKETDDKEANKISEVLVELGKLSDAVPLLERAVELAAAEAEAKPPRGRASVAPRSLKKNEVKEQAIRRVIDRIISKLSPEIRKNTTIHYPTSMDGLRQDDKSLYEAVIRSRAEQGDAHTIVPAGFYLRNPDGSTDIILFSDNIEDETHATLVFLEEMVSHHGFGSLLGDKLDPFMEKLYDEDPLIAAAAEAYLKDNKGVTKAEAVEEVLAKSLAQEIGIDLDMLSPSPEHSYMPSVNIITRLINEIRKLLNKLLGKQTTDFMDNKVIRDLFAKTKQFARTGTKEPVKSHFNFTGVDRTKLAPPFYNRLTKAVQSIKLESAKASVWKKEIEKLSAEKEKFGLKKEQVLISGIIDWLNIKREDVLTKEQVEDYAANGGLQIETVVLAGLVDENKDFLYKLSTEQLNALNELYDLELAIIYHLDEYRKNPSEDLKQRIENDRARLALLDEMHPGMRQASHEQSTIKGGSDYTELLLRLTKNPVKQAELPTYDNAFEIIRNKFFPDKTQTLTIKNRNAIRELAKIISGENKFLIDPVTKKPVFEEPHFLMQVTDVLAHSRAKTRVIDNIRLLVIEEIQSTWLQLLQKYGAVKPFTEDQIDELVSLSKEKVKKLEEYSDVLDKRSMLALDLQNKVLSVYPFYTFRFSGEVLDTIRYDPVLSNQFGSELKTHDGLEQKLNKIYADIEDTDNKIKTIETSIGAVLDAPMKNSSDWAALVLKRMIRYAAEKGSKTKGIAWWAGNVQNGTVYPVYKAVSLKIEKNADGNDLLSFKTADGRIGGEIIGDKSKERKVGDPPVMSLSNRIGAADAKKFEQDLKAGKTVTGEFTVRTHPGWEFYDIILVNVARKIAKEFGTELLTKDVEVKDSFGRPRTVTMYYMPFSQKLRDEALYQGFSRLARTPAPAPAGPSYYHGSPNTIEGDLRPSSTGLFGPGVYLTPDKEVARGAYAGATGTITEVKVSGKLATRDQWKAATKKASQGAKLTLNAQAEIDRRAIADLEAQGFVGVQANNVVTVWKAANLKPASPKSRLSVVPSQEVPLERPIVRRSRASVKSAYQYSKAATPLYTGGTPFPSDLASAMERVKDFGINSSQFMRDALNSLKTMNFAARSNPGYARGYEILTKTKNTISALRTKYTVSLEGVLQNANEEERVLVSDMLKFTTDSKGEGLTTAKLRNLPTLFKIMNNQIVLDKKVFDTLKKQGRFTLEDFKKGRVSYEIQEKQIVDGKDVSATRKETLKAMPDLTENSPVWIMYEKIRDTMDEAALDRARADYAALFGQRNTAFDLIEDITKKTLTDDNRKFIDEINNLYKDISMVDMETDDSGRQIHKSESMDKAQEFMAAMNRVLIAKTEDKDRIADFAKYFPESQRAAAADNIVALRKDMTFTSATQYEVQQVITDLSMTVLTKESSELNAKRNIVGGYTPVGRHGRYQVRIVAKDPKTGEVFGIDQSFRDQLIYSQLEDKAAATRLADSINAMYAEGDPVLEMPVNITGKSETEIRSVRLMAIMESARETPSSDPGINLNEFMRLITRYGVGLTPEERKRLITGMTDQNARVRANLQKKGVPGSDPNSIPYISQHLDSLANITGKRENQHMMDALMDDRNKRSQKLWNADETRLAEVKAKYDELAADPNANPYLLDILKRALDHYAFMARRTQEEGGANTYKDRMSRDLAYIESAKSMEHTDFGSDTFGQAVRTWTAVMQLGLSPATAALNMVSVPLNILPLLATYNKRNGMGGGFGFPQASTALFTALKDTGGKGKHDVRYYDNLLANEEALAASGLTEVEAKFIREQIETGSFQASLSNALTNSSKGSAGRSPKIQALIDVIMSMFTATEQYSRRASGLAAFRLELERQLAAGVDEKTAIKRATEFGVTITDTGLGNYNMMNRPGFFRDGLREMIFMYKMYPITVVQLISSLDRKGQAMMLLGLFMVSGAKGLPFAEDIMDLLDTIFQLLGWQVPSVEAWATRELNELVPGLTPTIMRGMLDQMLPATVSSRLGVGNLIPGTSFMLAGSDPYRELVDVLGPAASAMSGSFDTGTALLQSSLSAVGIGNRETGLVDIARASPITMLRAVADTIAYAQTDAIVDRKGYISSYDLNAGTFVFRLAGFYPSAATTQSDVTRLGKKEGDYLRAVSGEFRNRYVKAALRNDRAEMSRVLEDVRDWNRSARSVGLEINNFPINARRALQEARKTGSERFIASAPESMRQNVGELREAVGADE